MSESVAVQVDDKELASRAFADVVRRTAHLFPDAAYHPRLLFDRTVNAQYGIHPGRHTIFTNADGTGTKPELDERMFTETGDYRFFEYPAFDVVAMVADDVARRGIFVAGIANSLDLNNADDPAFVLALARGMEAACKAGRFPLLNGEIAELGHRTPGYGNNHLNWNAVAVQLINREKIIDGSKLRPGQKVVALREKSIRSNGLTRARAIMENAFLQNEMDGMTKRQYVASAVRKKIGTLTDADILSVLDATPAGAQLWEQIQVPWHTVRPELTEKLLTPSTIYAPLVYWAQGGVDGAVNIPLTGCAHISGGGVPLKAQRMLEGTGLGLHLDAVFPDPEGVGELIDLAQAHPHPEKGFLVNERAACEQWNRGVGFLCVVENEDSAGMLAAQASWMGYEAAVAGEIMAQPVIEWRGETWDI